MHGLRRHVARLKDRAARGALCWSDGISQLQLSLYLNPTQPDPLLLPQPRQACYRYLSLCVSLHAQRKSYSLINTELLTGTACPDSPKPPPLTLIQHFIIVINVNADFLVLWRPL